MCSPQSVRKVVHKGLKNMMLNHQALLRTIELTDGSKVTDRASSKEAWEETSFVGQMSKKIASFSNFCPLIKAMSSKRINSLE